MISLTLDIFLFVLMIAGIFCTLIGMLTVFHWFKTPKMPADDSNRLNNISSWWIGLTRPNVLAKSYQYFRNDLLDNVDAVEKDKK
tara:strand:- start:374 stop:628 length:255 start_codon:yes stop_codon:yes gene_type:complete